VFRCDIGCVFSIDTDAHAVDRIVNTWPADTLLAWTES